jgi:hypothetical protein
MQIESSRKETLMDEAIKHTEADTPPSHTSLPPINTLLSDPAILAKLSTVMNALQASNQKASVDPPTEKAAPVSTDGLATILSDPTLLEKLPQTIAAIKPLLDLGILSKETSSPINTPAAPTAITSHASIHDRDNLLLSLKPFLSSGRRDAVDVILRIEKLGEILKQIK